MRLGGGVTFGKSVVKPFNENEERLYVEANLQIAINRVEILFYFILKN